jgi:hypothetical protein
MNTQEAQHKTTCPTCKQSLPQEEVLELIFKYGTEGGGSEVYRNAKGEIITSGSSGGMLEEYEDPFIQWTRKYRLWTSFWSEFRRNNKSWYRYFPLIIHDDAKAEIKKSIDDITPNEISSKWDDLLK